jgi:hypothetical protein
MQAGDPLVTGSVLFQGDVIAVDIHTYAHTQQLTAFVLSNSFLVRVYIYQCVMGVCGVIVANVVTTVFIICLHCFFVGENLPLL